MKKLFVAAALLMMVGLAVPAIADNSDDNANNKISIGFYFPANNQGSFSMVGAGDAFGPAEVTSASVFADPAGNGLMRITTTKALHYTDGIVYMATDGTILLDTTTTRESAGTWTLTAGTGIYAGVSGGGKYHWFRNKLTGILVGAYSGKMKLDDER